MKIAYFAGSLVKNLDGVSRVLYKVADYNKANDLESVFLSPDPDERIGHRAIALKGIRLPGYKEYKFSLSGVDSVEKKLHALDFKPDLIHLHSPCPAGLAGLRLAKRLNVPAVATYHTHFISYLHYHHANWLSPLVKQYMKYFYNQCAIVWVPSLHVQKELEKIGIRNTQVLPHGVDFTIFNKAHKNIYLREQEEHKKILLYAGRLVWEKNLKVLQQAIHKLSEKRNDFVLWIAGAGNAEAELKATMKNTKFLGFCDTKKLSQLYASSDIFIFPSATETFGNVTLEAMASGTCCIAANARGSADLISHNDNGMLFNPENPQELMQCLEEVLDNGEKRNYFAMRAFQSSAKYRWKEILDLQKEMYLDVIRKFVPAA